MRLIQDIHREADNLMQLISEISPSELISKEIEGTGGRVSVADILAYQIGWGKCLIRWYEMGILGEPPEMPGEGFSTWDYTAIAMHFYSKYQYDTFEQQVLVFQKVVSHIIEIVQKEYETGNLDQIGVWPWCTLTSGKKWPLSKWIRVNTASPYKRAIQLIRKARL